MLFYILLLTILFGLGAGCGDRTALTFHTKTLPGTRAEVWDRIVPVISNTSLSFVIGTKAEEPGFINLNFSTPDTSKYLDCRHLTFTQPDGKPSTLDCSEPQLTWRSKDNNGTWEYKRHLTLNGRVNIVLQELTNPIWKQTVVKIKSRYQVDVQGQAKKIALSHADSEALAFGNPDAIIPVGQVIPFSLYEPLRLKDDPLGFATGETINLRVRADQPLTVGSLSFDSFPGYGPDKFDRYIEARRKTNPILSPLSMQCTPTGQLERDLLALLN